MTIPSRTATSPHWTGGATGILAAGIAAFVARARLRLHAAQHARELSGLSDKQLADIGVGRSAIEPARPTIEVDAGLMRTLMSMR